MARKYRTTDVLQWGTGIGRNLLPVEVDQMFYDDDVRLTALEDLDIGLGISSFEVSANLLTVVMSDLSTSGPYELPVALLNMTGAWLPNYQYRVLDTFDYGGVLYAVIYPHTSAASFDAGAGITEIDYYKAILSFPSNVLPAGGASGKIVAKASAADFDYEYIWNNLADLHDVEFETPGPDDGDVLTYDISTGKWISAPPVAGSVANLSDVEFDTTGIYDGELLTYDSGKWRHATPVATKVQTVTQVGAALSIDLDLGEICILSLTATITSLTITGTKWLAGRELSMCRLFVNNTGAFNITNWNSALWPGGVAPTVTSGSGKKDEFLLYTYDGASTKRGRIVAQNDS